MEDRTHITPFAGNVFLLSSEHISVELHGSKAKTLSMVDLKGSLQNDIADSYRVRDSHSLESHVKK